MLGWWVWFFGLSGLWAIWMKYRKDKFERQWKLRKIEKRLAQLKREERAANMEKKKCGECGSLYFMEASCMPDLCPECTHHLYAYDNCQHEFAGGRCVKCYWDGSVSAYLKNKKTTQ